MGLALATLSMCGPLLAAALFLSLSLLWRTEGSISIPSLVLLTGGMSAFPILASMSAALLSRWVKPGGWGRTFGLSVGTWVLLSMISSPQFLSLVRSLSDAVAARGADGLPALEILGELTLVTGFTSCVVMFGVLLVELPLRVISGDALGVHENGVIPCLRLVLTTFIIIIGWFTIEDAAQLRLERILDTLRSFHV